jgi:hypothetical protein
VAAVPARGRTKEPFYSTIDKKQKSLDDKIVLKQSEIECEDKLPWLIKFFAKKYLLASQHASIW